MYISLHELGLFILFAMLLIAAIFLIITLHNVNKLVSNINSKITDYTKDIQKTMANLTATTDNLNALTDSLVKNKHLYEEKIPGSIDNIHSITSTLKNTGKKIESSMDVIGLNLIETAGTVKENTRDILTYAKVISECIRILISKFSKK
ncbi:DUF948 domain-containing protein [Desulfotruncus alcoholivorax]|uniref:DUF948 domain-containing protein n=1 Tax=Desulfotruncus alcoholivorax TaxID=265477 RepID=UPI0004029323|nr:DUF948 domain-containing protein [Desulfotruncus alcoholivorax]